MLLGALCVIFCLIVGQLFNLQVIISSDLQARAQSQWTGKSRVAARRGEITDRNGVTLALSATAYAVAASPRQVKDADAFARELSAIIDVDADTVARRVSDRTKGGVTLKRQVPREKAQELLKRYEQLRAEKDTSLNGLYLEEDQLRVYPMGTFLTQVLGLTTIDGVGQSGLEKQLDKYLRGKDGLIVNEVDGKGNEMPYSVSEYTPPVDGGSVTLTIDTAIQGFAEKAMRECYEVNSAAAVQALVGRGDHLLAIAGAVLLGEDDRLPAGDGGLHRQVGQQGCVLLLRQVQQLLQRLVVGSGKHLLLGRQLQLAALQLGHAGQPLHPLVGVPPASGQDVLALALCLRVIPCGDLVGLAAGFGGQLVDLPPHILRDASGDFFDSVHSVSPLRSRT